MAKDEHRDEVADTSAHDAATQDASKSKEPVPNRCPKCGSDDIVYGSAVIEEGWVSQDADCLNCHHSWYDVYKLVEQEPILRWFEDLL